MSVCTHPFGHKWKLLPGAKFTVRCVHCHAQENTRG